MCYTVFRPISAVSTCFLAHSATKSTAEYDEPGPTLVCRATLHLKCRQIVPANHRAALQRRLQYASCLVSFTFEVFLFAQRPERQVGSDMVDHCVQTALKLTHQRDRGRGEARGTKKKKKPTNMPCRRTCRSHSRLFVKQRPQNSQGRRFSAPLCPELLLVLLVGDARTSGK